jgi:peptidoglycan hydrolase-like protein with peptidoglycan-binding domain
MTVRPGTTSVVVATLQYLLRHHGADVEADAEFGPQTEAAVRDFQRTRGLPVDGVVGRQTWLALFVTVKRGDRGEAVSAVQHRLASDDFYQDGEIDGVFDARVEAAVRDFQRANDLPEDGIVGQGTWVALVATE